MNKKTESNRVGIVSMPDVLLNELDKNKTFQSNYTILNEQMSMVYAGAFDCLVESDLFEDVPEGKMIPYYDIIMISDNGKDSTRVEKIGYRYTIQ